MSLAQANPLLPPKTLRPARSRRGKESDRIARRQAKKLERAKRANAARLRIRATLLEARESLIDSAPEKRKRALENLNRIASIALSPRARAALQATVADGEARRGRIQEALAAYRLAKQTAAQNPRAYLRGALGEIILLLSQGQTTTAYQAAQNTLQQAIAHHNQYKAALSQRLQQAISGQIVQALIKPIHPALVAARLGRQFHTAGALDQAQTLYQEAIRLHPRGAVKAKAWLAAILLRQGKTQQAQAIARDALRRGKGKSRALGIWPTLIAAEQAAGGHIDLNKAFAILKQSTPRVRARQVHELVKALRQRGDTRWSQVITAWRAIARPAQKGNKRRPAIVIEHQEFPEINLNLEKIELCELKKQYPTPTAAIRAKALSILQNPVLSSREFIQVAKDYLRTLSPTEITPAIHSLEQNAEKRYPHPTARLAIRHSLAKEAAALGQLALARSLWQQTIAQSPSGSEWWGKALWANAALAYEMSDFKVAANSFKIISNNTQIPDRFRSQSAIRWIFCLIEDWNINEIKEVTSQIDEILRKSNDYRLYIDLAQQLSMKFNDYRTKATDLVSWMRRVLNDGVALAENKIKLEQLDAAEKIKIISALINKLYFCLEPERSVKIYEKYLKGDTALSRVNTVCYYEAIDYTLLAYRKIGNRSEAIELIEAELGSTQLSDTGFAIIANHAYEFYLEIDSNRAYNLYHQIVKRVPNHIYTTKSYYWEMLRKWKNNEKIAAEKIAHQIISIIMNDHQLYWKQHNYYAAQLLLRNFDLDKTIKGLNLNNQTAQKVDNILTTVLSDYDKI